MTPEEEARIRALAIQMQMQMAAEGQGATRGAASLYPGATTGAQAQQAEDALRASGGLAGQGAADASPVGERFPLEDRIANAYRDADTIFRRGLESATLGIAGDEANAAIDVALGRGPYEERLALRREREQDFVEGNPGVALATDVAGGFVPGLGMLGAAARAPNVAMRVARGLLGGAAAGSTWGFMEGEGGVDVGLQNAADVAPLSAAIGAAVPAAGGLLGSLANRPAVRAAIEAVPGVDELRERAGSLYERARQNGRNAAPNAVNDLAENMTEMLRGEGIVSPTGRLSSAYPRVTDALNMLMDYADSEMTPTQMQQVRKLLQGAAGSADRQERRLGSMMLERFDNFTDQLAPEFREANQVYRTAMQSELIDRTVELAGSRAGQFSGSGFENALRTEFRNLERQVIKGTLRVSPEERKMIERIARGGPIENLARDIGKAAPRGVVSTGITAGVPFAVGNAVGGPVTGGLLAGGALLAGEFGRRAATAMQSRNADMLSAVARNGGQPLQIGRTPIAGLLGYLERAGAGSAPTMSDRLVGPR